jgi:hypothetical protein
MNYAWITILGKGGSGIFVGRRRAVAIGLLAKCAGLSGSDMRASARERSQPNSSGACFRAAVLCRVACN